MYYLPLDWYKSLQQYVKNILYKLDVSDDYPDLPLLQSKDVYLMQAFVDSGFRGVDLKCLNFVCKYIQATTLADIASVDGHMISHQSFQAQASNGLCDDTG